MITKSGKNLFLFTSEFPFGNSEVNFLGSEIGFLAEQFVKVYVIPFKAGKNLPTILLPENVVILDIWPSVSLKQKTCGYYLQGIRLLAEEILGTGNLKILRNFGYHLSQILHYIYLAKEVKCQVLKLANSSEDVFYTYWFDEWTSILCILKKQHQFHNKIVSRAHGFDLYDYRNQLSYIFPRSLQLKNVQAVYAISKNGEAYLKTKFPRYKNKIHYSPLGTLRPTENIKLNTIGEKIRIVSCSSVIELKRVHKIVEILNHSTKQIQWIHFGDGPLLDDVKERCKQLPKNVEVVFNGHVENLEIAKFYANNFIDFFINVSKYEGVPVSMMEAISYGIPVIATHVGGVNEIVNEITGVLIPKDFDPGMVCGLVESTAFSGDARKEVEKFWESHFSAKKNYTTFCNQLVN